MRIPRIYSAEPIAGVGEHTLGATAAHYLGKVLRMAVGRPLVVFDGQGGQYHGVITELTKKTVSLNLSEFDVASGESPLALELAIGLSRGERFDWVLQKATELGVSRISPLLTERVEVKLPAERLAKKMAHWQQIIISACEQCGRTVLPELQSPSSLSQWLVSSRAQQGFVLHHRTERALADITPPPASVSVLVGPEGGLSAAEIEQAEAKGLSALRLGPRVLRTETAPIAALSLLQYQWGDWR